MDAADRLISFVDASPTPFHACETAANLLREADFTQVDPRDRWPTGAGAHFLITGGTLVAWTESPQTPVAAGFRIVGAHTDSPNLRLKQHHDVQRDGAGIVALEPYGGPLLESWFDLDLGVAGRVVLRDGRTLPVRVDEPLLRVPRLAIHLDRDGAKVDRQRHLDALWGLTDQPFLAAVGARQGFDAQEVTGFDLMTFDLRPSARTGADGAFVAAPRLDNQATCSAAVDAFIAASREADASSRRVLVLFDHEEVGSTSERGAQSPLLGSVLERTVLAAGGDQEDVHRALAASLCVSGDMAHATHPNQPERHERLHHIRLGGGPVLKVNQNLRYATDAVGAAAFARVCEQADVPLQRYVHRADLPCGSTIGPLSAARTGILTVDVGAPQLAMHSAREVMAAADVDLYTRALTAFLQSADDLT